MRLGPTSLALVLLCFVPSPALSIPPAPGTLAVADWIRDAILLIDPATGNRTVLSASRQVETCFSPGDPYPCCTGFNTGSGCAPAVGNGPDFRGPRGTIRDGAGDLIVADYNTVQIYRVNAMTGARVIVSGRNMKGGCTSAGIPYLCCTGPGAGDGTAPCVQTGSGPHFADPEYATLAPDGTLYVMDAGNRSVFRVDPANGDRTIVSGCTDFSCTSTIGSGTNFDYPNGIATESSGSLLAVDYNQKILFRVDPVTGDRVILSSDHVGSQSIGSGPGFPQPWGVTTMPDGTILVSDQFIDGIYRVDPQTGNRTVLTGKSVEDQCSAFNHFPCCTGEGTGDGTPPCVAVGTGPPLEVPGDLAVDASGAIFVTDSDEATGRQGRIIRVDPVTGNRTVVSSASFGTGQNLAFPLGIAIFQAPGASIPTLSGSAETLFALLLASAGVVLLIRARRKKSAR